MTRWLLPLLFLALGYCHASAQAQSNAVASTQDSSPRDIQAGIREIAAVSVQRAVDRLGRPNGFYRISAFHIALPQKWNGVADSLNEYFASSYVVAVDQAINRAAEATAAAAGEYVAKALPSLTFDRPEDLLRTPGHPVKNALKDRLRPAFRQAIRPILAANLESAGARTAIQRMRDRYEKLTDQPFPAVDLTTYVADGFFDAFYAAVAQEERTLRSRPATRPTESMRLLLSKK